MPESRFSSPDCITSWPPTPSLSHWACKISYLQTGTKCWSLLGPQRMEDFLRQELFQFRLGVGGSKFAEARLQIIEIFIIQALLKVLESSGHIRLDGLISRPPAGWTNLKILLLQKILADVSNLSALVGQLESVNQPQDLGNTASHSHVVYATILRFTFIYCCLTQSDQLT